MLARSIVRAADLLILRDEESAVHLAEFGAPTPVRVGADPAWTLLPPERGQTPFTNAVAMRSAAGGHAPVSLDAGTDGGPVVVALARTMLETDALGTCSRLSGAGKPR